MRPEGSQPPRQLNWGQSPRFAGYGVNALCEHAVSRAATPLVTVGIEPVTRRSRARRRSGVPCGRGEESQSQEVIDVVGSRYSKESEVVGKRRGAPGGRTRELGAGGALPEDWWQ